MDIIDLLQNKRNFQSTGSVSEEDIKTIVTHEQMVNVEYKVEEDK